MNDKFRKGGWGRWQTAVEFEFCRTPFSDIADLSPVGSFAAAQSASRPSLTANPFRHSPVAQIPSCSNSKRFKSQYSQDLQFDFSREPGKSSNSGRYLTQRDICLWMQ